MKQQLTDVIATTLSALGLELVEVERPGGGMLRIYIDNPTSPTGVTIDDCERATRQLQHVFTVENVDYARLEVSSPGLDRPLNKIADFVRFAGSEASVTLKRPIESRKHFKGVLLPPDGETLAIEFEGKDGPAVLDFTLSDIDRARLVPQVDFRSRKQ
ncbi:ribosome maturation factor RimP [Chitinasiproducens palmae]|uniref:Ribosome maturation factor RimP n=1 Tax=Chitinasiproducens palmae TaxID=1770053 RepID=A0A1H2PM77_9BURK|nr:ribosome maturation factor RimP [Chitinasiproducens palmae]SDV47627.1 ribosome maturation factor RimP [Chitinasiproducens palmae]